LALYLVFIVIPSAIGKNINHNAQFDERYWKELVKEKQYNENDYTPPKLKPKDKALQNEIDLPKPIKYALLLLALFALIIAIFYVIRMIRSAKNEPSKKVALNDIRLENIASIELSEFDKEIHKYLDNGDFKLAFRWRFLKLLKHLEEKNLIQFERDKTNKDYYHELNNQISMHQAFGVLCLNFDPIWYGHKSIGRQEYLELEEFFKICEKELDLI
jgi:hypothetical protein